jgi:hypothetical protein
MDGTKSIWTRCTLFGAGAGPVVDASGTAMGGGPVGAGPGEAGKSSAQAGLGETACGIIDWGCVVSAGALGEGGSFFRVTGAGAKMGAASAAAIAGAGLAKSVRFAEALGE